MPRRPAKSSEAQDERQAVDGDGVVLIANFIFITLWSAMGGAGKGESNPNLANCLTVYVFIDCGAFCFIRTQFIRASLG